VRLMLDCKRWRFSTGETSIKAANSKAVVVTADIKSQGFDAAIKLHSKRRDEIPDVPTINDFTGLYRLVITTADSPSTKISSEAYVRCLERICEGAGVKRIRSLSVAVVERFKDSYIRSALPDESTPTKGKSPAKKTTRVRDASGARATFNGILRNVAVMFSKSLLAAYQLRDLALGNPFADTKLRRIPIKAYSPFMNDLIKRIWQSSTLLRDGDSMAPAPTNQGGQRSENAIDFREPQLDAFAILQLELCLGLRRNEADNSEWAWIMEMPDGRRFLEVRGADVFVPKSKQFCVIPIDPVVWESLVAIKPDPRFIVPAPKRQIKRRTITKSAVYRCEEAYRVLVIWLRKAGVTDPKPCHALRKEFGSYVATCFSLFHAQKLLGHSTPAVTSAYYASLTDLPHLQPSRMGQSS
jgi:integrase